MCYRAGKCECPHYITNLQAGNYNACGDCDYIKQLQKVQRFCRYGLVIAALSLITLGWYTL